MKNRSRAKVPARRKPVRGTGAGSARGTGARSALLRRDPTRTGGIRRAFARELRRRFARLRIALAGLLVADDAFGLRPATSPRLLRGARGVLGYSAPTANAARQYAVGSTHQKLAAFKQWLNIQMASDGLTDEAIWAKYVEDGFRRGAERSYRETAAARSRSTGGPRADFLSGYDVGTVESILREPANVEAVKALAARSLVEMEDVTARTATKLSRILVDGLVTGKDARAIAREMAAETRLSEARALLIAQTEITRAHAEGQLNTLASAGVEAVEAAVEWETADDGHVCEMCEPLGGVVLTIDEARGLLPRHPRCRCAWSVPKADDPSAEARKTTRRRINAAVKKSLKAGGPKGKKGGGGAEKKPAAAKGGGSGKIPDRASAGGAGWAPPAIAKERPVINQAAAQAPPALGALTPELFAFSTVLSANGRWVTLGEGASNPGQRVYIDDSGGVRPGGPDSPSTTGGEKSGQDPPRNPERTPEDIVKELISEGLVREVDFGSASSEEAQAIAEGLRGSMEVDGVQFVLAKLVVSDQINADRSEGGLAYGSGRISVATGFLKTEVAKVDREATRKALEGTGGERNYSWQDARDKAEAIRMGIAHEVGHHISTALLLDHARAIRAMKNPPTEDDKVRVSGYASTHNEELFAELHAFRSTGRWERVPEVLKDFYRETLKTRDPEPIEGFTRNEWTPVDNGWITLGDGSTNPGQHVYVSDGGGFQPGGPGSAPTGYAPKENDDYKPTQKEAPPEPKPPPRAEPRYGTETHDRVIGGIHAHIDGQRHLTDAAKHEYKTAITQVLTAMPKGAVDALAAGTKKMRWHSDVGSVTSAIKAMGAKLKPTEVVPGFYSQRDQSLNLNGGLSKYGGTRGVYAHELTHGMDPGRKFSGSAEWKAAYEKEIVAAGTKGHRLSEYAKTKPSEGFAEFGRLLYGSQAPRALVKQRFPESYKFFKDNGLIED